jgi:hypothetical protein
MRGERLNSKLAWESPPVPEHGIDWEAVASLLRSRPGEWLKIFDSGLVSVVNAVRGNGIRALQPYVPPGRVGPGFEVRTRNNNRETKTCTLYLRWVPGSGE